MLHRPRLTALAAAVLLASALPLLHGPSPVQASTSSTDDRSKPAQPAVDLVKDIWPGPLDSDPTSLVDFGGVAYFAAQDGPDHRELWRSDGTEGGTRSLGLVDPAQLTPAGDRMYFVARSGSDGQELWRTDGTELGTTRLTATATPMNADDDRPEGLTAVGDRVFFSRYEPDGFDRELWTSDGTAAGTHRVADIQPGRESSDPRDFTAVGGQVYFTAYDSLHGRELWRSDGTELGTTLVADIDPGAGAYNGGPEELTAVGDQLYFTADDGVHGRELWTSDGTPLGTHLVVDISDRPYPGSRVGDLTAFGERLAFMAHGDTPDRVLWISDGTAAGTRAVSDVSPGSELSWLTAMGDYVYFSASDDAHDPRGGFELWRSDGTPEGTMLVANIDPVPAPPSTYPVGSLPSQLTVVGHTLFFTAYEPTHGASLWSTDGTAQGTGLVEDVEGVSRPYRSSVSELVAVGDELYLAVIDTHHGVELWSTAAPTAALPRATNESPPSVVGSASEGGTVTAEPGSWSPPSATFSYEWFGTGREPAPTSRTVTLDENAVGSSVSVLVTATSPGYRTRSAYSAPVVVTGTVRFPEPPRVVGTPRVGAVLHAEGVTSIPVTALLSYDWFVRGSREPIGRGPTLRVPASAVGRPVAVRVTGLANNWDRGIAVSTPTRAVRPGTFSLAARPVLTGRARVGSRLAVKTGEVSPAADRTVVQWRRNGRPLVGSTGPTYRVRSADKGTRLSVRITWSRAGYEPLVRVLRLNRPVRSHQVGRSGPEAR